MKKYGLIGFPLKHSFSRQFFNNKFESESIVAEYVNFEIPDLKEFKNIVADNKELCGLNVTIPYKEQIIPYLDSLANAKEIEAVNVIKFDRSKGKLSLIGYNSDIMGFQDSIEPILKEHHTKALILGTGGASKAVFHGLKNLGIESKFVSRTKEKGDLTYNDLTPEIMEEYTVIVNTTPIGMYPNDNEAPEIPYKLLNNKHLLYDLLYNPNITRFMVYGKEQGATVKNGLEMLLLQAFHAWEIWNK